MSREFVKLDGEYPIWVAMDAIVAIKDHGEQNYAHRRAHDVDIFVAGVTVPFAVIVDDVDALRRQLGLSQSVTISPPLAAESTAV